MNNEAQEYFDNISKREMYNELIKTRQLALAHQNMSKQFHESTFVLACELYKKDANNKCFNNGIISDHLLKMIKKVK